MASRKRETNEMEPRTYLPFMFKLDDECNIFKKTIFD